MGHEIEGQTFGNYSDGLALQGTSRRNQPSRLVVTLGIVLRLTQRLVQCELHQSIRSITPDTTAPAYGLLAGVMSGTRAQPVELRSLCHR